MSIWGRYFPRFCRWESWTQRKVISLDPSACSLISTFFTYTERDWRMRCTWIMGFFGVPFKKCNYSPLSFLCYPSICAHISLYPCCSQWIWMLSICDEGWYRIKYGRTQEWNMAASQNAQGLTRIMLVLVVSSGSNQEAVSEVGKPSQSSLASMSIDLFFSSMSGWQFSGHSRYWIKQWSLSSPITTSDQKTPPKFIIEVVLILPQI